ncbi:hypothetical protein DFA_07932 [Cavenderia fasciculata]|uniref:IPT/TIG domain-containing protein n=1 Tax=Cavenderia fasciculata TaxID=261658 RepID=F4Q437_CACFS|nr:uncharacterized protein DFA_07932 [Cavenderia fasciculata]EGG16951.1 hypothetical protein DFA_07932 [Cavenderia fasciculata]|eukprot:XP_004355425.1 hypothetical protein DFA_07932 [Cavenderia fasciculata]
MSNQTCIPKSTHPSEQIKGYCPFNAGEPSLTPVGEHYIYMSGPPWSFKTSDDHNVAYSVCELEPISEVYVPSIGTDGGSITINNLSQFNISTINITFYNPSKQLSKSCQITQTNETSVTCIVPRLSGFHNVIVQDASGTSSTHYAWQPYPPFIKAVYPSFEANGLVILIGDNFGDDTNNRVSVHVSTSNIPCNITSMYQCFNQSLDMIGYEAFRFWQGVSNNSVYNIYDRTVSSNIRNVKYYTPLITFYTTDTPIIDSVTNIQFGQASPITIKGNHFGKDHSYVLVFFNEKDTNTLCKSPRFIGNSYRQMTCLLDFGLSNPRDLQLLSGSCECDIGYDPHVDCSSLAKRYQLLNTTVFNITTSTLSTNQTITGVIVNFTTGIQFIREIIHDNSIIRSMSMDVVSWAQDNQTQGNLTSFGESIFYGTTNNQSTRFHVTIGQFPNTTINTFAGEDMQLSSNSLKYTIKIIDWVWSSPFSTLQVIFHSRSDSVEYD